MSPRNILSRIVRAQEAALDGDSNLTIQILSDLEWELRAAIALAARMEFAEASEPEAA